jgi:hypothetical protein
MSDYTVSGRTDLSMMGMIVGGILALIFVGYMVITFLEGRKKEKALRPERFAGVFTLIFGFIMLGTWGYYIGHSADLMQRSMLEFGVYAIVHLVGAISLLVAGWALIKGWTRGPALLLIAMGIILFTTIPSLLAYNVPSDPFLLSGIAVALTVVFAYFVGLVYSWEHFVLHLDDPKAAGRKPPSV